MNIGFDADQDCSRVAADAVAAGASFCCRYLKNLTVAEVRALSTAGLKIVSVFESTAKRALGGGEGGAVDGDRALAQAMGFGQPRSSAIYTTTDFDVTSAQEAAVLSYLASFRDALRGNYKLGLYGNAAICAAAKNRGLIEYIWLTGSMGFRGSRAAADAKEYDIIQGVGDKAPHGQPWTPLDLGIEIDSDIALTDDYGGWLLGASQSEPVATKTTATDDPIRTAVVDLQTTLKTGGFYAGAVDGDPGPQTVRALANYRSGRTV